ncbi:DMT family transporter [Nitrosomonas sp. JL21]|uniref:DMT family transporter n=1 Tax=Nitrosomonas sp. JL21 TaxID=153949 RepID=UPI0031F46092
MMRSMWMVLAAFMFACMGVLVKLSAPYFSSTELVFYRSLFGVWMTYMIIHHHRLPLRTPHWRIHCWRGVSGLISLLLFFYCLTHLPLATAISLNYTWPLFVALLTTLVLKEHNHWLMIGAIGIGFIGVILLLRPTLPDDSWDANLLGIASGFFAAIAYMNVKQLGNLGETEWHVVFYFTLISTVMTGGWLAFTSFHPITANGLVLLVSIGMTATLAQLAMTRAYHRGAVLVVTSLGYSTVIFACLWGMLVWDEVLPPIAWLGMGLIILGGSLSGILGIKLPASAAQK